MPLTDLHPKVTSRFRRAFQKLSSDARLQAAQALLQLRKDPMYPSLHTKKVHGLPGVYEARASRSMRILWQYGGPNTIILIDIGPHNILP